MGVSRVNNNLLKLQNEKIKTKKTDHPSRSKVQ